MGYVEIDMQGARRVGLALADAAAGAERARRQVLGALSIAGLHSGAGAQLAVVQDNLSTLGAGLAEKANLAEQLRARPKRFTATLEATAAGPPSALTGFLGFSGLGFPEPPDLRSLLRGLPPASIHGALDAAMARLSPALQPAAAVPSRFEQYAPLSEIAPKDERDDEPDEESVLGGQTLTSGSAGPEIASIFTAQTDVNRQLGGVVLPPVPVGADPGPISLAGFPSSGQQLLGTPFPPVGFRMDWLANYVIDETLTPPDADPGLNIPGISVTNGSVPGLPSVIPEPIPPRAVPFDMIRPRTELDDGWHVVGAAKALGTLGPKTTIPENDTIPILVPDESGKRRPEAVPRFQDSRLIETQSQSRDGSVTFNAEQSGVGIVGGIIPVDAKWGTSIGVSRTRPDGTVPDSYIPKFGSELANGESYSIWVKNQLGGAAVRGIAVEGGLEQGRQVEVTRVGETLQVTVFPEVTQIRGGVGVGLLKGAGSATVGGERTTMVGEQYILPLDQPNVSFLAYELLRVGGAAQTPPHSLVTRAQGGITAGAELLTEGGRGLLGEPPEQTETRTRYEDGSEQVTGELVYPGWGVRMTYAYAVNTDGSAGAIQNVRREYLDPTLPDRLPERTLTEFDNAERNLAPIPSPVPQTGLQLSISPDNKLDGAAFVGSILTRNNTIGGFFETPTALTLEQYREWATDTSPGGFGRLNTMFMAGIGVGPADLGPGGAIEFLAQASSAFKTFDLDRSDDRVVPWNRAIDGTPPPGTTVDYSLPVLIDTPTFAQAALPTFSEDTLPDFVSSDPLAGYRVDEQLSTFSTDLSWHPGTSFDGDWSSAWSSPEGLPADSTYVGEYL